jgi:mannose-6-phosphate isomerase
MSPRIGYPLLLKPVYKNYIWGGNRIPAVYNRPVDPDGIYAESWEIADRPEGMSIVTNGSLASRSLRDLVETFGAGLLGEGTPGDVFPLLVKVIDAREHLSVQVHPNNGNAALVGGEPKTEMWYVLHADPGTKVFAGLRDGIDREQFLAALNENRLDEVLRTVPVSAGDVVFVPGGRVHAIDAGCFLLEIQQNSNTTYRVYDWGRAGSEGRPRELHVEKALQVIDWHDSRDPKVAPGPSVARGANSLRTALECDLFRCEHAVIREPMTVEKSHRFHALFITAGEARVDTADAGEQLVSGTSCLVPADAPSYDIRPIGGETELLKISLP